MSEYSNECLKFTEGIAHPNEKVLAKEILEGKKVGEFSLSFDQAQVDAMTERLKGGGCFPDPVDDAPVEEAPAEDAPVADTAQPEEAPKADGVGTDAPAQDDAPKA